MAQGPGSVCMDLGLQGLRFGDLGIYGLKV